MRYVGRLSVLAIALLAAAPARADVAPEPGRKRVGFSFVVKGLSAAPDRVLFAYPCGDSNGAPIVEHKKIDEGVPLSVGRRGGACTIYSIAKTTYEPWAREYKPTRAMKDEALEKLASQSVKCSGGPTPTFEIASSDARTSIEQILNVTTLNATDCVLAPSSSASGPSSSVATSSSTGKSSSGCAVTHAPGGTSCVAIALACAFGLSARRRRRA